MSLVNVKSPARWPDSHSILVSILAGVSTPAKLEVPLTGSLMPVEIILQQTPDDAALLDKREQLAAVRTALAEGESELAQIRAQLKTFEGRYLRQVGVLYAEDQAGFDHVCVYPLPRSFAQNLRNRRLRSGPRCFALTSKVRRGGRTHTLSLSPF